VFNFSPKGSIVVKATTTPRIGQIVCDNKGRPLGKVIRITGPVSSPYVLVSSLAKDEISMYRLSGKQVFLDDRSDHSPPRERRTRPVNYQKNRAPPKRDGNRGHGQGRNPKKGRGPSGRKKGQR
jgi:rRNA processing protein Gar1